MYRVKFVYDATEQIFNLDVGEENAHREHYVSAFRFTGELLMAYQKASNVRK